MTCKNGTTSAEEIHTPFLNVALHKRAPFLFSMENVSKFKYSSYVVYL
ncbi:hypothetical protein [Clostridium saccharobutylicum]|nr:hypothetical protein [Clostridium saccharobutylicum]MBC2444490.1 hypothetical protein [Clostridium saccharobutylicum]MBC2469595.1 hypothetical protein [Clostridium saccharobutylicum]MBC2497658.1 hypothetical protein [Clostridium saccharobutylicum]MBC2510893.1 hypothetical protein [Clostridium saccharobutylicum]MBC2514183.1 hypothetical protein [Clostridium saccharobutylicum]